MTTFYMDELKILQTDPRVYPLVRVMAFHVNMVLSAKNKQGNLEGGSELLEAFWHILKIFCQHVQSKYTDKYEAITEYYLGFMDSQRYQDAMQIEKLCQRSAESKFEIKVPLAWGEKPIFATLLFDALGAIKKK